MGCGSSSTTVAINLDRTNAFFFAGEIVSGTVQLCVNDDKLEADEIDLMMIGEIGYTTKHTTVNNKGQHTTQTINHDIPFLSTKCIFARPQAGEKELTYNQGQYSWPFQMQLPAFLPPTIGQPQSYPYVRYYLQVLIDKAWYKPNTRQNRYITVYPPVNPAHQPNYLMPTTFGNSDRKNVILRGTLNKIGYIPGEMIQGTIEIDNPQCVLIKQIDVTMLKTSQIGTNPHQYVVFNSSIPEIICRREPRLIQPFSIMIPFVTLPPTCQYQGGLAQVATVNITYMLKFVVVVEGLFTNFEMLVPITIGTA